jgi:hypothetical protein
MTTFAKRLPILVMLGALLALVLAGGSTPAHRSIAATEAAITGPQPTIQVTLNGAPVQGISGSHCWPQTGDAPQCDFVPNPQPTTPISVVEGDELTITIDPAAPAPASFFARLMDDKNADGDVIETDLLGTGGVYVVPPLTDGAHRLLVEAVYPTDPVVGEPFVSSAYLLIISGGSASTAEAQPTESTLAGSTEVPTEVAPTEIPTEVEPTEVAPTEIPTEVPTEVTPELTEVPVGETPTEIPTEVAPTVPPTEVPTIVPPTQETFPTITPIPTSTGEAVSGQPTLAFPPTESSIPASSVAPAAIVMVGGREFEPVAISACVLGEGGEQTCINRPSNAAVERIFAAPGDAAQINFGGPRPTTINVSLLSSDATSQISKTSVSPDNLILIGLPTEPGSYVLTVEISWPNGKATYYYRLVIGS